MVGIGLIVKGLTLLFAVLAYWFYTPPVNSTVKETAKNTTDTPPMAKTKETYAYDNAVVDRS